MTMYPTTLTQRFAAQLKALQARVTKLESRTASIDSGYPMAALPGIIDPTYGGTGEPMVYINGQDVAKGPFQYVSTYTPSPGAAVLLLPLGVTQTYVILGELL